VGLRTDLAALIESLQLAPAHVVGHSFSGSIALRLAGERPDLIRSLVVHEPPLMNLLTEESNGPVGLQEIKARIAGVVDLLEAGEIEAGVRQFVETIAFGPGAWEDIPALGAGHEPEQSHPDVYVATLSEFILKVTGETATITQGNTR
jgi:pimeloyl-ACP methyl ester carboxylesterase